MIEQTVERRLCCKGLCVAAEAVDSADAGPPAGDACMGVMEGA